MIRDAEIADLETLTTIYNEVIGEGGLTGDLDPVSPEQRRAWFDVHQGRYPIMVKVIDGAVVGYASLSPYRGGRRAFDATCELSYFLARRHRGRGLGRDLIDHAIARAGGLGFRLLVAIALDCNRRSVDILHKYGFVESGRIPGGARIGGAYVDHLYLSRPVADQERIGRP
jgi:L-amino acid N-acyltransferase YncA